MPYKVAATGCHHHHAVCCLQVRAVDTGSVALSQVVTEQQLVEHSEAFENAIAGRDRAALQVSWAIDSCGLGGVTVAHQ